MDLEATAHSLAMVNLLGENHDYDHFHEQQQLLNAKIINLLSAARLYLDTARPDLSSSFSKALPESSDGKRVEGPIVQFQFEIDYFARRDELTRDPKFKSSTLGDLPDRISLKSAFRVYVGRLSAAHTSIRDYLQNEVAASRLKIEQMLALYSEHYSGPVIGLKAFHGDKASLPIMLEWDNIRQSLQQRNKSLSNLHLREIKY